MRTLDGVDEGNRLTGALVFVLVTVVVLDITPQHDTKTRMRRSPNSRQCLARPNHTSRMSTGAPTRVQDYVFVLTTRKSKNYSLALSSANFMALSAGKSASQWSNYAFMYLQFTLYSASLGTVVVWSPIDLLSTISGTTSWMVRAPMRRMFVSNSSYGSRR